MNAHTSAHTRADCECVHASEHVPFMLCSLHSCCLIPSLSIPMLIWHQVFRSIHAHKRACLPAHAWTCADSGRAVGASSISTLRQALPPRCSGQHVRARMRMCMSMSMCMCMCMCTGSVAWRKESALQQRDRFVEKPHVVALVKHNVVVPLLLAARPACVHVCVCVCLGLANSDYT